MSLTVSPELLERAATGDVDDATFIECIASSLPYAWDVIKSVVDQVVHGAARAVDNTPPPDDESRGQLLRLMASDPMRAAIERHYHVKLAFQNCHFVSVFRLDQVNSEAYRQFISPRAQLLNQSPELVNC